MASPVDSARLHFTKIRTEVPVRYRFFSKEVDLSCDTVFEGTTCRLAPAGFVLVGKLPSVNWIPGLLLGKIVIGVNILLPSCAVPIKALARVGYVEALSEGSDRWTVGLHFLQIDKEQQDQIVRFVIRAQLTPHK